MRYLVLLACLSLLAVGCTQTVVGPNQTASSQLGSIAPSGLPIETAVDYQRVLQTVHDVYGKPFLFVITSSRQWSDYHRRMVAEDGLVVLPSPEPPEGVNLDGNDGVLIVGTCFPDGARPVEITALGRRGNSLLSDVRIDWPHKMDPVEYSPTDLVKFKKWQGLKGSYAIGAEQVFTALREMALSAPLASL